MLLQKQIKKFCKVRTYKKYKRNEKIAVALCDKVTVSKNKLAIGIYQREFKLDRNEFRIVERKTYQGHFAYKVYNKLRCMYQLYSPYFDELINI